MDQRPHSLSDAPARDTADLLYGDDTTPGIVAVEQLGANRVRLYRRSADGVIVRRGAVLAPGSSPSDAEPWQAARGAPRVETLAGDHPLRYLVEFPDWSSHLDAVRVCSGRGRAVLPPALAGRAVSRAQSPHTLQGDGLFGSQATADRHRDDRARSPRPGKPDHRRRHQVQRRHRGGPVAPNR